MSEVLLEVAHLYKRYDQQEILRDVSFSLEAGTATALVGATGTGKSSLIRILAGLEVPEEGSVSLFGSANEKELCRARQKTGFVLETPFGYEELTVLQNLALRAAFYGKPDRARIKELRKELRLTEKYHVGVTDKLRFLSPRAEKRYSLACALMQSPRLLILDELLTGIDEENLHFLTDQLIRLRQNGTTIFITSPTAAPPRSICSLAFLLDKGVLTGPVPMEEVEDGENGD